MPGWSHRQTKKPDELKRYFTSLDRMKYREKWWVIDIGGNNLRMMF
ncbi:type II toxin-antitoxin system HigB family toxin, partial [Acinetobacter baumannii]